MKIMVLRQACCSHDDQIGPLDAIYDVDDQCRLDEFLDAVEASGFLQFSSTHSAMGCFFAGREVARVFRSHHLVRRKPVFTIDPATLVRDIPKRGQVEFFFANGATGAVATGEKSLEASKGSASEPMVRQVLQIGLRVLLCLSAVLSGLTLYVGLVAGFNLWRLDRPGVTIVWLILVLLPIAVYRIIRRPPRSTLALGACALLLWVPPCLLVVQALPE